MARVHGVSVCQDAKRQIVFKTWDDCPKTLSKAERLTIEHSSAVDVPPDGSHHFGQMDRCILGLRRFYCA